MDLCKRTPRYIILYILTLLCWRSYVIAKAASNSTACSTSRPLGLQSGAIPNRDITQSTILQNNIQYSGYQARLQNNGAWISGIQDSNAWIQIRLPRRYTISGIATQGYNGYVKQYTISISIDGSNWKPYTVGGVTKVFTGNTDVSTVVRNNIDPTISGRFFKLNVKKCDNYCSLRMELYGCNSTVIAPQACFPLSHSQGSVFTCTSPQGPGSVCTFSCKSSYVLVGGPAILCQDSGFWNDTIPICYRLPDKPSMVQVDSSFANSIDVSWSKPMDGSSSISDYTVVWSADNQDATKQKITTMTKAKLDVLPYTYYTIRVQARNKYGASAWSMPIRQRSDEAAPSMTPSNFAVKSLSSLSLTVTWGEIPPEGRNGIILGYYIFYKNSTSLNVPENQVIVQGNHTFTYNLKNLQFDAYFVSVAGYTRIKFGPRTSTIRALPLGGAPSEPQNLQAMVNSSTSIALSWKPPLNPNGQVIKYTVKYGFDQHLLKMLKQTTGVQHEMLIDNLQEYTMYYFFVYGETAQMTGQPSQIVSAKTLEDAPDKTPIIISSQARDAYTIFISWDKIPAADRNGIVKGYIVFHKITGQQMYRNKTINHEGKLSTEITGLSPYTEVCVKIAAFTNVGLSKNWDQQSCTNIRTQQTGPSAPLDVVLKPKTSTSIEVSWKKPKTTNGVIKQYLIFYGQDKDNFDNPFSVRGQNYHHVLTGLKKFTMYYVQIRGETTESGNASAVKSVKTLQDAPSAPLAFRAKEMSPNSIALFWSEPKELNGILQQYLINVYEKKSSQKVGKTIVYKVVGRPAVLDEYIRLVHSLKPYREYFITIQAVTIKPGKMTNTTAKTQEGVPSKPKNVHVKLSSLSLLVQWDPPDLKNGLLKTYRVYCNGERPYDFKFSDPRMKEVPVNKTEVHFDKLKPGTKYVVTVTAKTSVGEGKKSNPEYVNTDSEAPPAPTDPDMIIGSINHHSMTIILNSSAQSNGEIIAHQIIVEILGTLSKRSLDPLPKEIYGYKDAKKVGSRFYVAAEFRGSGVPPQFVLGDGKHYSGYYNAPLEPSTRYRVYIRGVTKDGDGKWIYGHAAARKLPATAKDPTLKQGNDDIIGLIAGIVGALILIVIIVVAVLLYRRSRRPLKANVDVENSKAKSRRRFRDLELKRLGKKRPLAQPGEVINDPEHPAILMENFAKHVHKLHKSDDRGFMIEYNKLDIGRDFQCENAYLQDNKNKNRYGNIVAYDHSRVVLSVLNNKQSTDYINASHIDGYNKPSAYIATQGPVPHTFEDFWRMVWEQQSSTIVMLTNLQERHKLKCHKYWPDDTEDYGDISVKQIRCEHYADYSIRTLNVKRECEKEEREVRQFHFTVWPDHGVPEYPTAILAFRRRVRAYNPPDAGPIIVHCSAGVGRSGTFIVIDAMLDRIKAEKTVDIFNYVAYLRSRRTCMVQTEEQYTFCHDAILEAIQCGNTQILAHDLRIALSKMEIVDPDTKMTRFEKEFKTLNKVSPVLPKACYIVAMYPENKGKNRYQDILASDFSRVVLTAIDDNELTTYINAVHISGYKQQHAFIITHYPLKATITDFWRMLCEQESACIVVFQPTEEGDFPQFWPEEGKQIYDEMITVECQVDKSSSIDNLRSDYSQSEITECRFKVQDLREPEKELNIKMFFLNGWTSEDEPPDTTAMITLVAKVEKWQQQSGNGAITVMCSDGIGRSGTFCSLYSVLERVKIEQVVDVLQAIKAMRIPRPGLVKTTAEYRSIHYTVQEYLAAFDDYANFK